MVVSPGKWEREAWHSRGICREAPSCAFPIRLLSLALLPLFCSEIPMWHSLGVPQQWKFAVSPPLWTNLTLICSWWLLMWGKRKDGFLLLSASQFPLEPEYLSSLIIYCWKFLAFIIAGFSCQIACLNWKYSFESDKPLKSIFICSTS